MAGREYWYLYGGWRVPTALAASSIRLGYPDSNVEVNGHRVWANGFVCSLKRYRTFRRDIVGFAFNFSYRLLCRVPRKWWLAGRVEETAYVTGHAWRPWRAIPLELPEMIPEWDILQLPEPDESEPSLGTTVTVIQPNMLTDALPYADDDDDDDDDISDSRRDDNEMNGEYDDDE